jgi:hypothetical protein
MSIADLGSHGINADQVNAIDGIHFGFTGSLLNVYIQTGLTGLFTGPFPIGIVGAVRYRVIGKTSYVTFGGFSTATTSSAIITYSIPLTYVPAQPVSIPVYVIDNGTTVLGNCMVDTSGNVTIYSGFNSPFTTASSGGFHTFTICFDTV